MFIAYIVWSLSAIKRNFIIFRFSSRSLHNNTVESCFSVLSYLVARIPWGFLFHPEAYDDETIHYKLSSVKLSCVRFLSGVLLPRQHKYQIYGTFAQFICFFSIFTIITIPAFGRRNLQR